jgi:hypothetical protein
LLRLGGGWAEVSAPSGATLDVLLAACTAQAGIAAERQRLCITGKTAPVCCALHGLLR